MGERASAAARGPRRRGARLYGRGGQSPLVTIVPLLLITLNGSHDMPDGEEMADGRLRYWAGWDDEWLVSSVREKSFPEIGESVSGWWRIDLNRVTRCEIERRSSTTGRASRHTRPVPCQACIGAARLALAEP
jgi:hypothetical protein